MTLKPEIIEIYSEPVRRALASVDQRYIYPSGDAGEISPVIRQSFSVSNEPVGLQMLAWSDYLARSLDVPISRRNIAIGFRGEIDAYVLKDLVYIDSRTDPVCQARTAARISVDNVRNYVFHVAVEGVVETSVGSRVYRKSSQFTPGILALDMNQPMRMERPTPARVLAFFLPRAVVDAAIPDAESLHGRVIGYTSPLGRILHKQIVTLCRDLSAMHAQNAEAALRTCAQLLIAAFGKQMRLSGGARAAVRAAVHEQVRQYIKANLHRKELSPEEILHAHAMPRPTLYRMFEPEGGLVTYIRHQRLREAVDKLVRFPLIPVSRIAHSVGFSSHSDFTRTFHRTYGAPPVDFRSMGLEWLRASDDVMTPDGE
jgi:AraC-like DNA-binding protein